MTPRLTCRRALAVVTLLGATAPPAARAAETTFPIADGTADQIQVVADAAGNTTAVWLERASEKVLVRTATRPAGGTWTAAQTIVASRVAVKDTASQVVPLRLVTGPSGPPRLLWAKVRHGDGAYGSIAVATRTAAGSWSSTRIRTAGKKHLIGNGADLAATSDGTAIVVWTTATKTPSDYQQKVKPGKAYAQTLGASGGWSSPVALGSAEGMGARPQLAVNHAGSASVIWFQGDSNDPASGKYPVGISTRAPSGTWTPSPSITVTGEIEPPMLDVAGHTHLLVDEYGNYGLRGFEHRLVGPGVAVAKPDEMLQPTNDQTNHGWFGSGYLRVAHAGVDAAGDVLVVWGGEPLDVESGGYGIGTLWSSARDAAGHWNVDQVDPFTETTGASTVDLSTDAAGNFVATWGVDTDGPTCGSVIYRSVRGATGQWSPRTIVAGAGTGPTFNDDQGEAAGCQPVIAHATSGADPTLWWSEGSRLVLSNGPVPAVGDMPPSLSVTLLTPTWADVRRAGGLSLRCTGSADGVCSASVVGAIAAGQAAAGADTEKAESANPSAIPVANSPAQLLQRSLNCLALRATEPVTAAAGGTVTLARHGDCSHGWVPPTQTFSVLLTLDAPGQPPASQRMDVTITR